MEDLAMQQIIHTQFGWDFILIVGLIIAYVLRVERCFEAKTKTVMKPSIECLEKQVHDNRVHCDEKTERVEARISKLEETQNNEIKDLVIKVETLSTQVAEMNGMLKAKFGE